VTLIRNGETLAAFGATTAEDIPASLCGHPGAKSVGIGALAAGWLIRAFHAGLSSHSIDIAIRPAPPNPGLGGPARRLAKRKYKKMRHTAQLNSFHRARGEAGGR
jgi:hypothetical protein